MARGARPLVVVTTCTVALLWALVPARAAQEQAPNPQDEGLRHLQTELRRATDALVARAEGLRPEGKQLAIAPAPLIDTAGGRPRVLGRRAAEIVMARLTELQRPWLTVLNRVDLQTLVEEGKIATAASTGREGPASGAPIHIGRADLLIAGTTTVTRTQVRLDLRLVAARTGSPKAAEGFALELTPELRSLLLYPQRGPGGGVKDVAPVSDIQVTVTAQRADPLRGFVRQWIVEEGETLRSGDRFRIEFAADADACLYVLMYGSDGEVSKLFPPDDWAEQFRRKHGQEIERQDYYVYAEAVYDAPGWDTAGHRLFYVLDDVPGRNVIYFCAKRTEVHGIPGIRRALQNTPPDADAERMDLLKNRFGFDYVETFEFRQE